MKATVPYGSVGRHFRRWVLPVILVLVGMWLVFLDSHSLYRRLQWHREVGKLVNENAALQTRIDEMERKLSDVASDEVVEQIAREQYGMRKPGETVYRVEVSE